jgi:phage terminase large subunit-like protein
VRIGNQEPRLRQVPEYDKTRGHEVIDFMAGIGRPLDPWQALIILDAFATQPDGLWSAFELVVLVARQNGKGGVTEALELAGLFLFREQLIFHSAHQFKTSTAAFRRLQDIIDGSDWLTKRVKMISRSKGDESIKLTDAAGGGMLQFIARTDGSGRGLTGSTTVFDEAAWLTVGQYAAQTPGLSTIPNPRIIYTSTPPDEDIGPMPEDAMLPSVRKRGRAGEDRTAYYEWSPGPDDDVESVETMYECNPALGFRISLWFLEKQLKNFKAAGRLEKFVTEHEGAWPADADEQWQVVPEKAWEDAGDPDSKADGGVAIGISMPDDRSRTTIAIFGRRADGLRHGQLIEQGPGSAWVVDFVAKVRKARNICAVVIGANDPARSLIPDLREAGIEVLTPGTADVAAECGSVFDGLAGQDVTARDIRHPCQGPLTASMAAAARKKAGNAWLWARTAVGTDVSPLYAFTSASYGFRVNPPSNYNPLNNIW